MQLRRLLLLLVTVGFIGTATDLVLLEHYEDSWQLVPLMLIAVALVAIAALVATRSAFTVRVLQIVMVACVLSGGMGVALHYQGNLEIQRDMDPTLSNWELFKKVIRAKAPPALAPATMAQLGLLGLVFSYRHPWTTHHGDDDDDDTHAAASRASGFDGSARRHDERAGGPGAR